MDHTTKTLLYNYEEYYERASFIPQQRDKAELARFADIAAAAGTGLDILDIGAAEGALSVMLARMGHRVTSGDISPTFLQQVSDLARENNVSLSTMAFDVEKDVSCFQGAAFDFIYLMDVIEHLRSPLQGLSNIRTLLKDNGTLVIHTPNLSSLGLVYRYIKFRNRRENYFRPENLGDLHLQGYDYQTLEKVLNFAGLQVYEVVPTAVSLPVIYKFKWARPLSRAVSAMFPLVSDTLLVKCRIVEPIDMEKQMRHWRKAYT
jgi:SAM-dependent methyltransferase